MIFLIAANVQYTPQAAYTHPQNRCIIRPCPLIVLFLAHLFCWSRFENTPRPPNLLDQLRDKMRLKHYSVVTERQYIQWARRFIFLWRSSSKRHGIDRGGSASDSLGGGWPGIGLHAEPGPVGRCGHDHDLHPRAEPGWARRAQPAGRTVSQSPLGATQC